MRETYKEILNQLEKMVEEGVITLRQELVSFKNGR